MMTRTNPVIPLNKIEIRMAHAKIIEVEDSDCMIWVGSGEIGELA
jgi:hypothetical protein